MSEATQERGEPPKSQTRSQSNAPPQPTSPVPPEVEPLIDRLGPRIEEAKAQLSEINEKVKGFIRKNPGASLLGAVAIGYLVGKWASRR